MNEVLETKTFFVEYLCSQPEEREWIDKIKDQLKENLAVGKPLRYYWFREKRHKNYRLYYIINEKLSRALLVSYSRKKDQDRIIEHVIGNKVDYLRLINELF
ncbi:MAG: hypothetical protein AABX51_03635 [Nanoarchaeota archaeon]